MTLLAATATWGLEFNGYVQEAVGVRTATSDKNVLYHRQTFNMKLNDRPHKRVYLRFEADIWRDDADFQVEGSRFRTRLREGYVKLRFPDFDLRVGRMQIAWGEADGAIVADQISPFDLENFIIPKFDEIRLGVDGIALDYYFSNQLELQLLWIAGFEQPDFPDIDSPWSFIRPQDLAQLGLQLGASKLPGRSPRNSEFGGRLSGHPVWADWSIGYFRSWDDRPTLRPQVTPEIVQAQLQHDQFDLFTASIIAPVGPFLLKADAAYEHGRFLQQRTLSPYDPGFSGFVSEEDVVRVLIAADFKPKIPLWEQADASVQFIHEQVVSPSAALQGPEEQDLLSVRLSAAYLNDTVKPWILAIGSVRGKDLWIQAKIDYEPVDNWKFSIEYDYFDGHEFDGNDGGTFGRFGDNDLALASIRYSF